MARSAALLLLLLLAGPAAAQEYRVSFAVEHRTVPLPPGAWRVVADQLVPRPVPPAAQPTTAMNREVALLRVEEGRVTGLVLVSTSREAAARFAGWDRSAECAREDRFARRVVANEPRQQDCWTVAPAAMARPARPGPVLAATLDAAAAAGGLPPVMLRATGRVADPMHYLDVSWFLAPDPARVPPAEPAAWQRERLDADRRAALAALARWAPQAQAALLLGFRARPVPVLAAP
jgi:hypothetical protein